MLTCVADVTVDSIIIPKLTLRLLTRIVTQIERQDEWQFGDILRAFGQSLLVLELDREVDRESLLVAEFIAVLAAKLPLLNRLTLQNRGEMVRGASLEHFTV